MKKSFFVFKILFSIFVVIILGLTWFMVGCNDDSTDSLDNNADIFVLNHSDCNVDIYLDNIFYINVSKNDTGKIDAVTPGEHLIQAKLEGTNIIIKTEMLNVYEGHDIYWDVFDC